MARKHTKTLMTEKDGIRGLVPARNHGHRDRVFAEYLDTLNTRANLVMQKALVASPRRALSGILRPGNGP